MREYFDDSAYVNWHCTNEHFTVEEYIQANCEYPGEWDGTSVETRERDWYKNLIGVKEGARK